MQPCICGPAQSLAAAGVSTGAWTGTACLGWRGANGFRPHQTESQRHAVDGLVKGGKTPGGASVLPTARFSGFFFFIAAGGNSFLMPFKMVMVIRLGGCGSNSVYTQAHFNESSGDGEGQMILCLFPFT